MSPRTLLPLAALALAACSPEIQGGPGIEQPVTSTVTGSTSSTTITTTSSTTTKPDLGPCGSCAPGAVCNPKTGACEAACDVPGGHDPAAIWPMVGGCPTRRGLSTRVGPATAHVKWTSPYYNGVPSGQSSLITVGANGDTYTGDLQALHAIRPNSQILWSVASSVFDPPAVGVDGTLYQPDAFGQKLRALDPQTGAEKWSLTGSWSQNAWPTLAADGTIVLMAPSHVVGVTPAGQIAWEEPDTSGVGVAGGAAISADGHIYHIGVQGLVALSPTGVVGWTRPLQGSVLGTPTVGPDGTIYAPNGEHLHAFRPDGATVFDVTPGGTNLTAVSIGPDGTVYVVGDGVRAVSPTDGSLLWQFGLSTPGAISPPVVVDAEGNLYAALGNMIFSLTPSGTQRWTYDGPAHDGAYCAGLAVAADNTLFAGCTAQVIALGW